MTIPANKKIRQMKGSTTQDVLNAGGLTFSRSSGAQKNLIVGPHLKPILLDPAAPSYTTDATTARGLRPGSMLAVYNNSGTVGSVTIGDDSTVPALAVGVTNAAGLVGIACKPNDWTYISLFDKRYVRSSSVNLIVYVLEDDTFIIDENISK